MVSTRRSIRATGSSEETAASGTKRKEHVTSPKSEHEAKAPKVQSTIEDTINGQKANNTDHPMPDAHDSEGEEISDKATKQTDNVESPQEAKEAEYTAVDKDIPSNPNNSPKEGVEASPHREKTSPSNVLEKGIVYFFFRNRVGIEEAEGLGDLQRTYFVLRPLPAGAKLVNGAIPDFKNNRLLALPKKAFPKSNKDRFMAFVQKSNATIEELKTEFFQGSEYETKTIGTRRVDPVTPVGEGVYVITRTDDRANHLAYMLTIPSKIGGVQEELGLRERGSFVISVKNPERPGPASTRLPQGPEFSKEIIDKFRGLAWAELEPEYLDHVNCQILLIGENTDKATEASTKDKKNDKTTPKEELEELEHEDELRVEHLHGDDTVFDDLEISKSEYPKVPTTW